MHYDPCLFELDAPRLELYYDLSLFRKEEHTGTPSRIDSLLARAKSLNAAIHSVKTNVQELSERVSRRSASFNADI